MTRGRETDIIEAFVGLSNELVDDYDVVEMLARLASDCARILDIASAGLLLADPRGTLHLVAASSDRTRDLELFQLQREEGPCLDCFRDGRPVNVPDLARARQDWPVFVDRALAASFASVHALPMRLRDSVLGALGLFGDEVGPLNDDDLALAQALAHVASVAIVNEKSAIDQATVNAQLEQALTSRVLVEQAKGVLAQLAGLEMATAFTALRRYARDHGRRLTDVAGEVVSRELSGDRVIDHARSASVI